MLDDGYDGRRAGREPLAQRLQALIREARVFELGRQATHQGAHRRRHHQRRPGDQADSCPGHATQHSAFAAAHVGRFSDVQLAVLILADNGRVLDSDQPLPLEGLKLFKRLVGCFLVLKRSYN